MRTMPIAVGLLLILPASGFAHALHIACTVNDDKVAVEAFYDDDTPAPKAKIQVVNDQGEVIDKGEADERGLWSFKRPAPGRYEVRADAGAGHRAKRTIQIGMAASASVDSDSTKRQTIEVKESISAEPTREELTATPWLKIAIGLVVIVALGGAFLVASACRRSASRLR